MSLIIFSTVLSLLLFFLFLFFVCLFVFFWFFFARLQSLIPLNEILQMNLRNYLMDLLTDLLVNCCSGSYLYFK